MDVSVIIPCSPNHRKCLDELFAGLGQQTYKGTWEILLVLEGKEPYAPKDKLDIRIFFSDARSPSVNRNIGLKNAHGTIIAFIDSDCVPRADWLENLIKPLEKYDGVQGIDYSYDGTYLGKFMEKQQLEYLRSSVEDGRCKFIDTRNCAVKADILKKVGGFDERLETSEDKDLGYRLFTAGYRIVLDDTAVVRHRWKKGSLGGFFRWGLWYGRGDYIFSSKWPTLAKGGLGSILGDIRSSFFFVIAALRSSAEKRKVNLLFSARQLGVACGKLKAMLFKA